MIDFLLRCFSFALIADTVQDIASSASDDDACLIEEETGCCDEDQIVTRTTKNHEDQFST